MSKNFYAELPIFTYRELTLSPSHYCESRCRHCFIPPADRQRDDYHGPLIKAALSSLPRSIRTVCITGGEPFDRRDRLFEMIRSINDRNRLATVVTNGAWARDWLAGEKTLEIVKQEGLHGLVVSLDDYHRPALPAESARRLLEKANALGLQIRLRGVGRRARLIAREILDDIPPEGQAPISELVCLDNVGQADALPADRVRDHNLNSCLGILGPHVQPDGRVLACCSTWAFEINNQVLVLGNLKEEGLDKILNRASRDYLLAALLVLGPRGLSQLLKKNTSLGAKIENSCAVCVALLNDRTSVSRLNELIAADKKLRKEIVGKCMLLEECHLKNFYPEN
jgi:MoaA/NifB/PqqE/SkfB family radical SAM enzyme